MFFIIFGLAILSIVFATFRFPNLTAGLKSKFSRFLPRFNFSKWFKNPRIKTLLQDREFFNQNLEKILSPSLFVVIGNENYKIHNMLVQPDEYGVKKDLAASEDAFDVLELQEANFLFVHPRLSQTEKGDLLNSRMSVLIERICKYRRQKYIDGIVIVPHSEAFKKTETPPSKELTNEINFCTRVFQKFVNFFKVDIPLSFIAHEAGKEHFLKNVFKHDPLTGNNELYLGFMCDFQKKSDKEKNYEFFQKSMTDFIQAFNIKTQSILQNAPIGSTNVSSVNALYTVQEENFSLSKNYISFFLNTFDKSSHRELGEVSILNSILFSSFEGSTSLESLKNVFRYLSLYGKERTRFSERFLNSRQRINILLAVWTCLFVSVGIFTEWKLDRFLEEKRIAYIQSSVASYQQFAQKFNDLLANKFPFSSTSVQNNADFENIALVFAEFERMTKGRESYFLEHVDSLTDRTDIQNFVRDMKEVAAFLHLQTGNNTPPSTPSNVPQAPSFEVGVTFDFRSRPNEEFLANRIVDWSLSVGKENYGSKYGSQKHVNFVWAYGIPLNFKVEFFSKEHHGYDPALVPRKPSGASAQIQGNSHMYVQGNTVVFAYPNDSWSLLRFTSDHDICSNSKMPCPRPLLQFIIPLANGSNAVFFCNLELQNADGKTLIIPHFPTIAPLFAKEPNS